MAANTSPIFTGVPDVQWGAADGNGGSAGPLKTANAAFDGTGTVLTVFTAGSNGSYLKKLIARACGTNIASVLRIFINNGSTNGTIANNSIIGEISLPATTANAAGALPSVEYPFEFPIQNGYKINVVVGTTISAGWQISVVGGDY
jgi:hypothetical protein